MIESIVFNEQYLSSRSKAVSERLKIENLLKSGKDIEFDLSNVESISSSFADELFAILYLNLGFEFSKRVSFIGKNPEVIDTISDAIKEREREREFNQPELVL